MGAKINICMRRQNATMPMIRLSTSRSKPAPSFKQLAWETVSEAEFLERLTERRTNAQVLKWTLAEFLEHPIAPLQDIVDSLSGASSDMLASVPPTVPLGNLKGFLQDLRNSGMNPYLAGLIGDLPSDDDPVSAPVELRPG